MLFRSSHATTTFITRCQYGLFALSTIANEDSKVLSYSFIELAMSIRELRSYPLRKYLLNEGRYFVRQILYTTPKNIPPFGSNQKVFRTISEIPDHLPCFRVHGLCSPQPCELAWIRPIYSPRTTSPSVLFFFP